LQLRAYIRKEGRGLEPISKTEGEQTFFLPVSLCILLNDDINISVPPTLPKVALGFLHFFRYVELQGIEKILSLSCKKEYSVCENFGTQTVLIAVFELFDLAPPPFLCFLSSNLSYLCVVG
jgi:hypothetical protein